MTAGTPAPAVLRAAAILEMIASGPAEYPRISDIARATHIPNSSVTNVLAALVETGMVRRTGAGFSIGPAVVEYASEFLRSNDPVQRFIDFVPTLPTLSRETAQLATLVGSDVLFLARHDGTQPITLTSGIGKRLPASSTAIGKAMLAHLEPDEVAAVLTDPLPRLTDRSHGSLASLQRDLTEIRQRGHAIDDEEAAPNVMCLAVAVEGDGDGPLYAVSTTLFKERLSEDLAGRLVADLSSVVSYLAK